MSTQENRRNPTAEQVDIARAYACAYLPVAYIAMREFVEAAANLAASFAVSRDFASSERVAGMEEAATELKALRKFKKAVDIAVTAGLLGMSGEVGFKLPCHEFVTSIKVAFRQAETDYIEEFGTAAIRQRAQEIKEEQEDHQTRKDCEA